jgi:hypothetical protein
MEAEVKGIATWVSSDRAGRAYQYRLSGVDLLSRSMAPRPFFSERRRMERLSTTGLGAYLVLRAVYFALPERVARTRPVRFMWRNL